MKAPNITVGEWDLEEIPYETNDPSGGWYLHFDKSGENTDAVLYMSMANVNQGQAKLIAAAPAMARELHRALAVFKQMAITSGNMLGDWNWSLLEEDAKQALLSAGFTEE